MLYTKTKKILVTALAVIIVTVVALAIVKQMNLLPNKENLWTSGKESSADGTDSAVVQNSDAVGALTNEDLYSWNKKTVRFENASTADDLTYTVLSAYTSRENKQLPEVAFYPRGCSADQNGKLTSGWEYVFIKCRLQNNTGEEVIVPYNNYLTVYNGESLDLNYFVNGSEPLTCDAPVEVIANRNAQILRLKAGESTEFTTGYIFPDKELNNDNNLILVLSPAGQGTEYQDSGGLPVPNDNLRYVRINDILERQES